ncbi:hypothetical protein Aph02nite_37860 [Actinoplanes philippinensis]|uniref:Nitrite/Sulfite reductase ferredoxin-like half domain-containing protein n=1 Tax=Actinoplanes philippinensis TaxID=35752 RepID=A0A1I2FK51_9ACTN|nr:hypothetical protein [Actinoplanes philippinensis]GIE77836.1 hypothetical protein Aph02nite_37860 [Actinoplanes philippinensis]SFF05665.1 Nitrite/Sulfite reductase ferredoxin-like half domain-containing protein [Actinoplanes philippinensis]
MTPRSSDTDACPGALRLHAAADGMLARVRLPGGMLSGAQLRSLRELAEEFGDGCLELTSRANLQLRALQPGDAPALAARLRSAGLLPSTTHDNVRNIAAPPLPGSAVRALVGRLDLAIQADAGLAALPGKFLFALGQVPLAADVAAVPAPPDAAPPGTVVPHRRTPEPVPAVPGQRPAEPDATLPGPQSAEPNATVPVPQPAEPHRGRPGLQPAEPYSTLPGPQPAEPHRGRPGPRVTEVGVGPTGSRFARLDADLWASRQIESGAGAAPVPADPGGTSRERAGDGGLFAVRFAGHDTGLRVRFDDVVPTLIAAAHAFLAEREVQRSGGAAAWRLRELADGPARVSARVAKALGLTPVPVDVATAIDAVDPGDLIGALPQEDGLSAVAALVPLGRLEGAPLRALEAADLLVVTPWRGVVVADLAPETAPAWVDRLADAGLAVAPGSPWSGVTACAGRPGCAKSLADVRADATAAARFVDGLPVHWVGCARACGSPAGPHVRAEATGDGYLITRHPAADGDPGVHVSTIARAQGGPAGHSPAGRSEPIGRPAPGGSEPEDRPTVRGSEPKGQPVAGQSGPIDQPAPEGPRPKSQPVARRSGLIDRPAPGGSEPEDRSTVRGSEPEGQPMAGQSGPIDQPAPEGLQPKSRLIAPRSGPVDHPVIEGSEPVGQLAGEGSGLAGQPVAGASGPVGPSTSARRPARIGVSALVTATAESGPNSAGSVGATLGAALARVAAAGTRGLEGTSGLDGPRAAAGMSGTDDARAAAGMSGTDDARAAAREGGLGGTRAAANGSGPAEAVAVGTTDREDARAAGASGLEDVLVASSGGAAMTSGLEDAIAVARRP